MDLSASLSIATSGLSSIENSLSIVSQNIANSQTNGYVSEGISSKSAVSVNMGIGVKIGPTTLNVNKSLQASLYQQNAQVASDQAMNQSLGSIASLQGSTDAQSGSTNTLSDQLGNIRKDLISLTSTPTNSGSQSQVISDANTLVNNIHTLSNTYQTNRQNAQDNIVQTVSSINTDLTEIGNFSKQIMTLESQNIDCANIKNQRYEVMNELSSKLNVHFDENSKGDIIVTTSDGTKLPTRPDQIGEDDNSVKLPSSSWPLSTSNINVTPVMYHNSDSSSSAIPGIMLEGKDITSHLDGGTLGANLTLRDDTYPKMQAQLDSLSYTIINRFNGAGLGLFTNGSNSTLSSDATKASPDGLIGLSSNISVNSTYQKNPYLLTQNSQNLTDTKTISNVINNAFGTTDANVSNNLAGPTNNLGPQGNISTGYNGNQGLIQLSSALDTDQSHVVSKYSNDLTYATSVQTTLQTKVANVSGVNVNDELAKTVTLQNAYAANAKIISTAQTMFNSLIQAV